MLSVLDHPEPITFDCSLQKRRGFSNCKIVDMEGEAKSVDITRLHGYNSQHFNKHCTSLYGDFSGFPVRLHAYENPK